MEQQLAPLRIGMVVGEASGDILGASLIKQLKKQYGNIEFEGIGGPLMIAEGFNSHYQMDRLSVMGIVEPLKRLPELISMRSGIIRHFKNTPPDLFLGIDAPDFNLTIELKLREAGIKTAHYVSPSIWAWRQKRVFKVKKAVDMMLTLLPFEADFYRRFEIPVTFVGHPLADQLPMQPDTSGARARLSLDDSARVLCLMPGSRGSEIKHLGPLFLQVALRIQQQIPALKLVLPTANAARKEQLIAIIDGLDEAEKQRINEMLLLLDGDSHTAMEASDAVLLASGTTALEAMLLKKPMVVSYRLGKYSYALFSRMIKLDYFSLPNLLANKMLVPEAIQDDANVENLTQLTLQRLDGSMDVDILAAEFTDYHQQLKQQASEKAATALLALIEG
ncbi:Lipid-A-disaccharide synthase [Sinobacterium norvegicum]|uniref:Lipid-A-disaccharide synthase n=1 Tax=Sinobacterium norvegicum TaxID=1641715 RepID=A0ABN8EG64_9GAMM|nr:lipid-A-disaccharide synthase [Sinobacterium norvegicum]CAH0990700.1 Lipid-A-disaccharide synthase [Sinobacterium norvegicum]